MSLAAQIIERAERIKAQEGRYPVVCLPREEFDALLAECQHKSKGHPVRLRGILVKAYDLERKGEYSWGNASFTKRR